MPRVDPHLTPIGRPANVEDVARSADRREMDGRSLGGVHHVDIPAGFDREARSVRRPHRVTLAAFAGRPSQRLTDSPGCEVYDVKCASALPRTPEYAEAAVRRPVHLPGVLSAGG